MHRFFADKSQFDGGKVTITGDDVKHISRVLRLSVGDTISVCDKERTDYICSISDIGKDYVTADILESQLNGNESNLGFLTFCFLESLRESDELGSLGRSSRRQRAGPDDLCSVYHCSPGFSLSF